MTDNVVRCSVACLWPRLVAISAVLTIAAGNAPASEAASIRVAQAAQDSVKPADAAQSAATPAAAAPVGVPATIIEGKQAESLLGKQAQNTKGEDMGRIVDVIVDKGGRIRAAVIDSGGFLGVGSRKIAVDWRAIHSLANDKSDKILVDMPQDQLRAAPVYKEGEPVVVVGTTATGAEPTLGNHQGRLPRSA